MQVSVSRSYEPVFSNHRLFLLLLILFMGGCALYAGNRWDEIYGPAEPRDRMLAADTQAGSFYLKEVQPIIENRCVVCHGCYDSPCQLNLSAPQGIDRGASKVKVYNSSRLTAAPLTRLLEDAQTTQQWREMGFFPVLNEHEQTPEANLNANLVHHLLALKQANPLPSDPILSDEFTLELNRKQSCPKPMEIDKYRVEKPLWGMPYALPGLADGEYGTLAQWLRDGSQMAQPPKLDPAIQTEVEHWEAFLNGDSLKQQLMSRYLYEHWFLAHLYFSELGHQPFFRILRSSTPPGEPIQAIASRRPYDDPGVTRVYYRLWRDHTTTLDKTHMPYSLNEKRMTWLSGLFLKAEFSLDKLPSYEPSVAANPFIAFQAIPVENRWQFLLEEAQFTVMNFIKGPVCRGQVALNVIRDHFWVFFIQPEFNYPEETSAFINQQEVNLRIPTQAGSSATPFSTWHKYSKSQEAYLRAKSEAMNKFFPGGEHLTLDVIWDGGGHNQNAALTIFRHFDSASVVKGLVGLEPKTAWVVDYPILERIHYLLVAGFDVFGNVGHQLNTRLYMDFLRMEGESNFLALLPLKTRQFERQLWYEGASEKQKSYVLGSRASFDQPTGINYKTDSHKRELFSMLKNRLEPVLNRSYDLNHPSISVSERQALNDLQETQGMPLSTMPQIVYLNIQSENGENRYYSLLRNNEHSNITSLLKESKTRRPEQDTLTVARGFVGSYPSAFWRVRSEDLPDLVGQISVLSDEASYGSLMNRYGVRRTAEGFWSYSDKVMQAHHETDPLNNALLDYSRLENR